MVAALAAACPLQAAPVIVTLFGDVVAPRGGALSTAGILEVSAALGIGESRARTALSRLVAAGRLVAEKAGRRSHHRLTEAAVAEFAAAAGLIYAPVDPPPLRGWHLVLLPAQGREAMAARLARLRFGMASPQLAVLPDRGAPLPPVPGCRFRAVAEDPVGAVMAGAWTPEALAALAARMAGFAARFGGVDAAGLSPAAALAVRLMLVHGFREIALADPLLPPELLPEGWPGRAARAVFVYRYRALSPGADACAARLTSRDGPLRADPAALARRAAGMA